MQKKVSVIIPIYNIDKYIEECIVSIINQSYINLEIILVDDGSTDKSGKICDNYLKNDNRIKVIHKENRGSASAKNIGLKNATGDYIMFVDGDDKIELTCIENRVSAIENEKTDIVQSRFINLFKNKIEIHVSNIESKVYNKTEFLSEYIKYWECSLFANKLFKKEVIENVEFIEGRCIDDEFFTYKVIQNCKNITIIDEYDYYYRQRKSSVMNDYNKKIQILRDQIDFIYFRFLDIDKMNKKLKNQYLENLVDNYLILSKSPFINTSILCNLKNNIKSILFKILTYKFENNILKVLIMKLVLSPTNKILKDKDRIEYKNETSDIYFD